jgi:hypothetical protein
MLLPPGLFRQNSLGNLSDLVAQQQQLQQLQQLQQGAGGASLGDMVRQGSFNWAAVAPGMVPGRPGDLARSDTELSFNVGSVGW